MSEQEKRPNRFLELLARGGPIVADGAMGTTVMAAGLEPGEAPETWNVRADRRDRIKAVHAAYAEAGARIVLTNTFGASPIRLEVHGLADRAAELNHAGAELAREAVGPDVVVAGSIGPSSLVQAGYSSASRPQPSVSIRQ